MTHSDDYAAALVGPLDKVLPNSRIRPWRGPLVCVPARPAHLQVAWRGPSATTEWEPLDIRLRAERMDATAYAVGLVPVTVPTLVDDDDGYLEATPGLYPDPLIPLEGTQTPHGLTVRAHHTHSGWHSVWIDLTAHGPVALTCSVAGRTVLDVTIPTIELTEPLARGTIEHTRWFHADSLAHTAHTDVWSHRHWSAVRSHLRSAASMGVTAVMAPVWTPPLDTAEGTYRLPTQLLDVTLTADGFKFGFERLSRWIDEASTAGISRIELPPLYSQWGAAYAPAIWATAPTRRRLFGWDTPSTSPAYRAFLDALIPRLKAFLDASIGLGNCLFHVSDEPGPHHADTYRAAFAQVAPHLRGCRIIDAVGDPDAIPTATTPVVATSEVHRFRRCGTHPDWVYYCGCQGKRLANQFIAQRGIRHRMLGLQLYAQRASGFLHWAFNFYNTQFSLSPLDPWQDTCAGGGFVGGDSFVVYPHGDNVVETLRHRMIAAAFCDHDLFTYAETIIGRNSVLDILAPHGPLDYDTGWCDEATYLERIANLAQVCIGHHRLKKHLPTRP
ncbi:MAG: DUF4091 domain-containing protein [Actinomycetaceae bacterium]|nr:DUF4091 domain-containing protein [Actinomycetaceae bacterium]